MLLAKEGCFYAHIIFEWCNGKTHHASTASSWYFCFPIVSLDYYLTVVLMARCT